jgi:hypothetical protein
MREEHEATTRSRRMFWSVGAGLLLILGIVLAITLLPHHCVTPVSISPRCGAQGRPCPSVFCSPGLGLSARVEIALAGLAAAGLMLFGRRRSS